MTHCNIPNAMYMLYAFEVFVCYGRITAASKEIKFAPSDLINNVFCFVYSAGEVEITGGTLPPLNEPPNATAILDSMFLNYDKRLRPMYGGDPVRIYVSMGFLSISHVVEENMVTTDFIFSECFKLCGVIW